MWIGFVTFKIRSKRERDRRTQSRHSPLCREITKHPISHSCPSPFSSKIHKYQTPVHCCDYNYSTAQKFEMGPKFFGKICVSLLARMWSRYPLFGSRVSVALYFDADTGRHWLLSVGDAATNPEDRCRPESLEVSC